MFIKKNTADNVYKNLLALCAGLIFFYFSFKIKLLLYIALTICVAGVSFSGFANFVSYLWVGLSTILSYIVPNIILSILFFIVLTPIALIMRLLKVKSIVSFTQNISLTMFNAEIKNFDNQSFENTW